MTEPSYSNLDPNVYGEMISQAYWKKRSDLIYYRYVDYMVRALGRDAQSMIDVGSGNCPYLEWFDWIPRRVSVDLGVPYRSDNVEGIQGDIHKLDFGQRFDIATCLQVLEHVPDVGPFARRLLELADVLVVSVPFMWGTNPRAPGHVNDPVSYEKMTDWFGRQANYRITVTEPFTTVRRLIAVYDRDPDRPMGSDIARGRLIR